MPGAFWAVVLPLSYGLLCAAAGFTLGYLMGSDRTNYNDDPPPQMRSMRSARYFRCTNATENYYDDEED